MSFGKKTREEAREAASKKPKKKEQSFNPIFGIMMAMGLLGGVAYMA